MKITCPSCAATYEVPEAVLAAKRAVRCARCGNNWVPGDDWTPGEAEGTPTPQAAAAPAEPQAEAAPAPDPDSSIQAATGATAPAIQAEPVPPPPAPTPLPAQQTTAPAPAKQIPIAGWVVSIALLIILGAAAIVYRAPIMHTWPPSERLYAALGLYHPQ